MIVVIAGATGLVGSEVLKQLLDDPSVREVRALARRPLPIDNGKIRTILVSDLSEIPARSGDLRGDVYFCCLGTTSREAGSRENFRKVDYEAVYAFGKLALEHGARAFVLVSSSGANPGSPVFYSRVKGEIEAALERLGLKSLLVFRPSLLIGDRKASRPIERIFVTLAKGIAPLLPMPIEKRLMTPVAFLASRMIQEAKRASTGMVVLEASSL